jgi:excinuclease UvrABC nuclease subunit
LRGRSLYYGPFPTRAAAEKFANDALDFFKLRRCADDLHPDPAFPGCIYSEMKMCLAPCFRGCTDAEYRQEVERVQAFLDSGGQSLARELSAQRDHASTALEFENAAALHVRLEKLAPVLAQLPEIVHRIDQLAGVVVQPSAQPDCVALFRIEAGRLNGPIPFALQHKSAEHSSKPQSMESRLVETLATVPALASGSALETMEQLAYLKRWYYRTSKTGEIFFADEKGDLPLRRLVRGISRVFRGEKPAGELNETTRDYWVNRGRAAELNPEDYNV